MRLIGRIFGALVALALLLLCGAWAVSTTKLRRTFTIADSTPKVPTDSASIERGRYLARAISKCADCHTESLGGQLFIDGGPLGKVWSANLTRGRGGLGDSLTDTQLAVAIRHGVGHTGRPLLIMPAMSLHPLSDDDLGAIMAYVRSVPPVDGVRPRSYLGPLGWVLYATGQFPSLTEADLVPRDGRREPAPPRGVTVEYGRYLAHVGGCQGCHGDGLGGGPIPGMPPDAKPAANLTPTGIGRYTEADFFHALRDGKRPNGSPIDSLMPYKFTREMTDDDIRAVYAYLKTVPPRAFGSH